MKWEVKMLTGKPTEKRFIINPNCRWKDNIRIDLKEININVRNLIGIIGEPL